MKPGRIAAISQPTFWNIFFNENVWNDDSNSLNFVAKVPINNIPALMKVMAWRRPGDKPISETIMVRIMTYICVTWPQWVTGKNYNQYCLKGGKLLHTMLALYKKSRNLWIIAVKEWVDIIIKLYVWPLEDAASVVMVDEDAYDQLE